MTQLPPPSPPHIVVICRGCGEGGSVGNTAVRHAAELRACGRVTLVSDSFPAEMPEGVRTLRVDYPRRYWLRRFGHVVREIAFDRAARRVLDSLDRDDPVDALIGAGASAIAVAAPVVQRRGARTALVVQAEIFDRPPGTYDPLLTRYYRWATPRAYRGADLILSISPQLADLVRLRAPADAQIEILPNGFDPEEMGDPGDSTRRGGSVPRLLCVARIAPEKGVDVLIRACGLLKDRGIAFTLDLVGDGPLLESVKKLTTSLGLDDRVHFAGRAARTDLGRWYGEADILCVPSINEPLGIVVLEGMAAGCALIASRVGGIPSAVTDGVSGLLVPAGSPEAIADAVARLVSDRSLIASLGEGARARAEAFSWKNVGARLRTLVTTELVARSTRRAGQRV